MARPKQTQGALAKQLGISRQAVTKLVARGMPLGLDAALAWRAANLEPERRPPGRGPSPVEKALRIRKLAAQVSIMERTAKADTGEHFAATALASALGHWVGLVTGAITGVGSKLEGELLAHIPEQIRNTMGLRRLLVAWERGVIEGVQVTLLECLTRERIRVPALESGPKRPDADSGGGAR